MFIVFLVGAAQRLWSSTEPYIYTALEQQKRRRRLLEDHKLTHEDVMTKALFIQRIKLLFVYAK